MPVQTSSYSQVIVLSKLSFLLLLCRYTTMKMVMFNCLHTRISLTHSSHRLVLVWFVFDVYCSVPLQDEDGTAKAIVKAIEKGENEYQVPL